MYIGDEYGLMSVLKYDVEDGKLLRLPYSISSNHLNEAAGFPSPDHQPVVGVLPQPCSSGNRVLIAYENGLIILWDVSEGRVLFVGGGKDLQLKDGNADSQNGLDADPQDNMFYNHLQEKEITALCWASSNGSILAIGYVDGDILFWKTSTASSGKGQQNESLSGNVVKLQLSPAERRLPVIVLHWSASNRSSNGCDGQLFIYGGDGIGSEEVLTVLTLEWSPRMETLRCTARADLTLTGSFADMILLPHAGLTGGNNKPALFVLTNPGQVHLCDDTSLSALLSQQERKSSVLAVNFPSVVPMGNPPITVSKLSALAMGANSSKFLSEIASVKKQGTTDAQTVDTNWLLTGGVPAHLSSTEHTGVERVYIAGYQDGSVRVWNASYNVLSLICILEGKVEGVEVVGFNAPVSSLDFCSLTLNLAVGNEHGLVQIYNLDGSSDEKSLHFVTESKCEVHNLPKVKGRPHCRAVLSLLNSPIHVLAFTNSGAKLAVTFECGRVAVLDMSSLSVLFFTDCVSSSSSPIISVTSINCETGDLVKGPKHSEPNVLVNPAEELMFFLTKDAVLNIINSGSGGTISYYQWRPKKKSIAISMSVIVDNTSASGSTNGKHPEEASKDLGTNKNQTMGKTSSTGIGSDSGKHQSSSAIALTREALMDSLILLSCEDSMRLYSTKNVIQGSNKSIFKVKHVKPCCWTSAFKKDGKVSGLFLLFQTGVIEIRSFPDLKLVKESSLMSILRWNYKANMEKMMSSDNEQISLANGCELAFISLPSSENGLRVLDTFPCLHDKVLAAAADAAISMSSNQKKKQGTKPGILGGIVKGLKQGKIEQTTEITPTPQSNFSHLEGIFSKSPFSDSSPVIKDTQEAVELDIDDIEIDESPLVMETSSQEVKKTKKEKVTEREQLLGKADDIKPRLRTPEEIIAQYRKAGDASSVAAHARNKLVERQEKLERISRRTAELQNGAEDFASMANELVKAMENRKWWQI
ncbi:uncharacterized protein LOC105646578 isoform X2 [Jatropha curcas]|nr:uncharacterized protein LOC105646578 isoform X2 [Jatropha curcas]